MPLKGWKTLGTRGFICNYPAHMNRQRGAQKWQHCSQVRRVGERIAGLSGDGSGGGYYAHMKVRAAPAGRRA